MVTKDSGKLYLELTNHTTNFLKIIQNFYEQESLANVTLSCEGKCLKAHKLILSASSDYFKSILKAYQDWEHPIIYLDNVNFTDLKYVVTFMYHGELHLPQDHLINILALGKSLQVKGLGVSKPTDEVGEAKNRVPSSSDKVEQQLEDLVNEARSTRPKLTIKQTKEPQSQSRNSEIERKQLEKLKKTFSSRVSLNSSEGSSDRTASFSSDGTVIINPFTTESTQETPLKLSPARSSSKKRFRRHDSSKSEKRCRKSTPSTSKNSRPNESKLQEDASSKPKTPSSENTASIRSSPSPEKLHKSSPLLELNKSTRSDATSQPNTPSQENVTMESDFRPSNENSSSPKSNENSLNELFDPRLSNIFNDEILIHVPLKTSPESSPIHESSGMFALLNSIPEPGSPESDIFSMFKRSPPRSRAESGSDSNSNAISGDKPSPVPNAFMMFSKEFRQKFKMEYPAESNSEILKRMAITWETMIPEIKAYYYKNASKRQSEKPQMNQQSQLNQEFHPQLNQESELDQQSPLNEEPPESELITHQPIKIEDENLTEASDDESTKRKNFCLEDHNYVRKRMKNETIVAVIDLSD